MAYRSLKIPLGVVKNLVVQAEEFTIPTDFLLLEMESVGDIPLILGHQCGQWDNATNNRMDYMCLNKATAKDH